MTVLAKWVAHRGHLAFSNRVAPDSTPARHREAIATCRKGRPRGRSAVHVPFWDAPSDVWRCAWCGTADASRTVLSSRRCRGLPVAVRMLLLARAPAFRRLAATAPDPGPHGLTHRLWRRGLWYWCSRCCGVSSVRLRLLGKPCSGRMPAGNRNRVARLWSGVTPTGPRALLPGFRPCLLPTHHLTEAFGSWADGLSEACVDDIDAIACRLGSSEIAGAGAELLDCDDAWLPAAFSRGIRAARRLWDESGAVSARPG